MYVCTSHTHSQILSVELRKRRSTHVFIEMASRTLNRFVVLSRNYSSKADKNVAFLGLGNMGGYMAANLVKKVLFYIYFFRLTKLIRGHWCDRNV